MCSIRMCWSIYDVYSKFRHEPIQGCFSSYIYLGIGRYELMSHILLHNTGKVNWMLPSCEIIRFCWSVVYHCFIAHRIHPVCSSEEGRTPCPSQKTYSSFELTIVPPNPELVLSPIRWSHSQEACCLSKFIVMFPTCQSVCCYLLCLRKLSRLKREENKSELCIEWHLLFLIQIWISIVTYGTV